MERLEIPAPWSGMKEGWGSEARKELGEVCEARGIELRYYEWRKEMGVVVEPWEGYLDDW